MAGKGLSTAARLDAGCGFGKRLLHYLQHFTWQSLFGRRNFAPFGAEYRSARNSSEIAAS